MKFPKNKAEKKVLLSHLENASDHNPLTLFAGSCPDYSHVEGKYDHRGLGGEVPLLSQVHIHHDLPLLKILEEAKIPYRYILMIADVEALDSIFCETHTGGEVDRFLDLCRSSQHHTAEVLQGMKDTLGLGGELVSSSFFEVFGREIFMHYQEAYSALINGKLDVDSFQGSSNTRNRVNTDTHSRQHLYRKVYRTTLPRIPRDEQWDFLMSRTVRTMAQYLTLGRLIRKKTPHPVIINHPTTNAGLYNDLNKFVLEEDSLVSVPSVPIFEVTKAVY